MSEPQDRTRPAAARGRWLPEFLLLSQKRVRGQARMLGLSTLIGIVAGLGAIVFYTLVQTVEHTTMAAVANYEPEPHPASYAVVGMASFFAAAAKTPFSTLVMVSEMTGGYHLLLPALWGCSISFMTSDEQSIYDAQVESRSRSPAHQGSYVRDVLSDVRIERFLPVGTLAAALHAEDTLDNVLDRFDEKAGAVLPVVDGDNRLVGVVNLDEVFIASHAPELRPLILTADLMRTNVVPLSPSDSLDLALELFVENDLRALPIVNNLKDRNVLGMITRTEVTSSYLRRLHGPLAATAGSR
jgi:CIC family chloride channel protein